MKIMAGRIFIWRPREHESLPRGGGPPIWSGRVRLSTIHSSGVPGGTQRNETGRIKGGRGDRVGEKDGRMMKGDWRAKRKMEIESVM